jgi:hypothetical protein
MREVAAELSDSERVAIAGGLRMVSGAQGAVADAGQSLAAA